MLSIIRAVTAGSAENVKLQTAGFLEAVVPAVADDDVVEHRDAEDLARSHQAGREDGVVSRWRRIAAGRMIV